MMKTVLSATVRLHGSPRIGITMTYYFRFSQENMLENGPLVRLSATSTAGTSVNLVAD